MIEVTNLTKRYGKHLAVDGLSFRVEKGQIYGFLGPNGAGKSTTMNIITGYLAASEGTVLINGKDIQKEPEAAKSCIGYLPEQPPVYMDMTVLEYLKFVSEVKKIPKAKREEEIEKVMEMTWISDVKGRLIKNLSKGYRQRVGMAQALLGDPEVIILDEPTVGMDPRQIIEIRDLIRSLGQKHTVILSSHILSEVSAVCDQIMIISHGKLVASDTPAGLQNLMRGSERLLLEVKGEWEKVSTVLSTISTIEAVEKLGNPVDNTVRISVLAKEGEDVRETVFYSLAEQRLPILSMQQQTKTLEDIFLELTEGENQEVPGKDQEAAEKQDTGEDKETAGEKEIAGEEEAAGINQAAAGNEEAAPGEEKEEK